jgi:hypothetical protein
LNEERRAKRKTDVEWKIREPSPEAVEVKARINLQMLARSLTKRNDDGHGRESKKNDTTRMQQGEKRKRKGREEEWVEEERRREIGNRREGHAAKTRVDGFGYMGAADG